MLPPSSSSSLRALCQAISKTPPDILPQTTPYLLTILNNCGAILSAPESYAAGKEPTDSSVLVHKYTVQLSALLQGKSFQARWVAVVLIKATIELGDWEILRSSGAWARGLLGILAKPDPPTTHGLAVVSLTKMYLSIQPYQTLKREIVTPTLPQFITSCLNLVRSRQSPDFEEFNVSSPLLPNILDAFCILIPHHPTLFRPHLVRIGLLISPLLAPTTSPFPLDDEEDTAARAPRVISPQCATVAQHLHVLLPYCAPKKTSSGVWLGELKTTVLEVHKTSDQVFRAVIEDWEPTSRHPHGINASTFGDTVGDDGGKAMGLPGWTGIQAGIERLVGLLGLLVKYIATPTGATVSLPLGSVLDILTRIFSLTVPSSREKDSRQEGIRLNPQIGTEEREGLWVGLPQVHVAGMELLVVLVERLGSSFFPMVQGSLDQISWVFNAEQWNVDIRTATYTVLAKILCIAGVSLPKSSVSTLSRIFKSCCHDLLPPGQKASAASSTSNLKVQNKKVGRSQQLSTNADSFLSSPASFPSTPDAHNLYPGLRQAAHALLPLVFLSVPSQHLQLSLRSQVDRTAILTQHKGAMIASVLYPPGTLEGGKVRSSILPHFARSYPRDPEAEGLFRPRMPVIPTGGGLLDTYEEDEAMEDICPEEEPPAGGVTNDMANTGLVQSNVIPCSKPSVTHQDAQLLQPISLSQQSEGPPPLPARSKRYHDPTDSQDGLNQSGISPRGLHEAPDHHGPPSPKRLRVGSAGGDSRAAAGQGPVLSPPLRPAVEPSEPVLGSTLNVHKTTMSATVAQASTGTESDEEFEVPELVMDADTDEAEEIEDAPDGSG
ncbi:MAG: hypothetical protein M1840_008570 [Geoglossum simile]|nr:MAG: hypothetical protein M1840_008570 [Geoglossum simile]